MNHNNSIIKVNCISKKFTRDIRRSIYYAFKDVFKDFFSLNNKTDTLRDGEFWALKDINFSIKKGQCVALVGRNGSGKTTLLRLLAGIFSPDSGEITVEGRIGALIALGAAFHPNMTGRENIFLNASLMGMKQKQIIARVPDIIDFAEIGDFIDAPVSTYSSGMSARLGFSIAAFSDSDILLVDEVLAVGDLPFALKCYKKMAEFRTNGGTTILVTHNNQIIRNICDYAFWLDKGSICDQGPAKEIADKYELKTTEQEGQMETLNTLHSDELARVEKTEIIYSESKKDLAYNDSLLLRIHYNARREVKNALFGVTIENMEKHAVICNFSNADGYSIPKLYGRGKIDFKVDNIQLRPGKYSCTVTFSEGDPSNNLSWIERAAHFQIKGTSSGQGIFDPKPNWELIT